jgi:hypothetical protein
MTDTTPRDQDKPDPDLAGAGLSATGKTADQFSPGDDAGGTTYGDPAGTGTAERESTSADPDEEAGADAGGDVEGA